MAAITAQGHGYLITVKGNQPTLHRAVKTMSASTPLDAWSWSQGGHGHDAHCRLKVWSADPALRADWSGLQRYISVRRWGQREGKTFDHTTYYISSEPRSAWWLAQRLRGHRRIENTLHWTKDVVLHEDDCGLVDSQAATTLALIRNISFNLLVMAGYRSISDGIDAMGEQIGRLWTMISEPAKKQLRI